MFEKHMRALPVVSLALTGALLAQARTPVPDLGKRVVERPLKVRLKNPAVVEAKKSEPAGGPKLKHRKVAPGRVAWHRSFDAAKAAAAKSGKPVLLFQLLGKLDDEFC